MLSASGQTSRARRATGSLVSKCPVPMSGELRSRPPAGTTTAGSLDTPSPTPRRRSRARMGLDTSRSSSRHHPATGQRATTDQSSALLATRLIKSASSQTTSPSWLRYPGEKSSRNDRLEYPAEEVDGLVQGVQRIGRIEVGPEGIKNLVSGSRESRSGHEKHSRPRTFLRIDEPSTTLGPMAIETRP